MNLTNFIKIASREDFGRGFRHTAAWSSRLRTTGGRFFPIDGHLDFNPGTYEVFGVDVFRKIVRHEFCHYHLYFKGKGYKHADADFKALLKAVDGLCYVPAMPQKTEKYLYRYQECGQNYHRERRVNTQKHCCGRCHGKPLEIEDQEIQRKIFSSV